jgi:hypothetical protein
MPPNKPASNRALRRRFSPRLRVSALAFISMRAAALQLLLPVVLRRMVGLVIDVDVAALDVGERFELDLERFCDVVRFLDGLVLVDDDINFHDEAGARVPGADGVEGEN